MSKQSRWFWFFVLLVGSLAISVVGTLYLKSPFLALFLVFPFMPFLFGGRVEANTRMVRACTRCGYSTDYPLSQYCPRDGSRLG